MSIHNFATANLAGASGASSFFNGATSRSLRFDGGSYAHKTLSHKLVEQRVHGVFGTNQHYHDTFGFSYPYEFNSRGASGGGGTQSSARFYLNGGRITFSRTK